MTPATASGAFRMKAVESMKIATRMLQCYKSWSVSVVMCTLRQVLRVGDQPLDRAWRGAAEVD